MSNKSKNKGKSFEREVCKYLSDLYSCSFTRVPYSGAFVGKSNAVRKDYLTENQIRVHKGDIIPPDEWKFFNAEAKSYAEFPFHHLLIDKSIPLLEEWIDQTLDAEDDNDVSIIFIKITRRGRYIVFKNSQNFKATRFVEYVDKHGVAWKFTSFEDFFRLNKDEFKSQCVGTS